jgi:hypothetical protein
MPHLFISQEALHSLCNDLVAYHADCIARYGSWGNPVTNSQYDWQCRRFLDWFPGWVIA